VTLDGVPGYITAADAEDSSGWTFRCTLNPTVSIPITIYFNDNNNADGNRPKTVTVRILTDGVEIATHSVQSLEGWTYTFTGISYLKDNGEAKSFDARVDEISHYSVEYHGNTICLNYVPEETSASVSCVWNDTNNAQGTRPREVAISLYNGVTENPAAVVLLSEENGWVATVDHLPVIVNGKETVYAWKSQQVLGYTLDYVEQRKNHMTFTFSLWERPENPSQGKKPKTPGKATYVFEDYDEPLGYSGESSGNQSEPRVAEAGSSAPAAEPKVADAGSAAPAAEPETEPEPEAEPEAPAAADTGSTVAGSLTVYFEDEWRPFSDGTDDEMTEDYTVSAVFSDNDNADGNRPQNITVRLFADGIEIKTYQLDESNGWKVEFGGLPVMKENGQPIHYSISVDPVRWYSADISGMSIRMVYEPELTSEAVLVVWDDENNALKKRPESIVMKLNNGQTVMLSEENGWGAVIDNLPTRLNGNPAEYTFTAQRVMNYDVFSEKGGNVTTFTLKLWKEKEKVAPVREKKSPDTYLYVFDDYETPL